jgi:hypothetical protein
MAQTLGDLVFRRTALGTFGHPVGRRSGCAAVAGRTRWDTARREAEIAPWKRSTAGSSGGERHEGTRRLSRARPLATLPGSPPRRRVDAVVQERIAPMLERHPGASISTSAAATASCAPCPRRWPVTVPAAPSCGERIAGPVAHGCCKSSSGTCWPPSTALRRGDQLPVAPALRPLGPLVGELAGGPHARDQTTAIESANRVAPALFGAKKKLEGNTRPSRLHPPEVAEASRAGLRARAAGGPVPPADGLHRAALLPCSAALEAVGRGLASRAVGSLVIAGFTRGTEKRPQPPQVRCVAC